MQCFTTDTHALAIRERHTICNLTDGGNHIDLSPVVNCLIVSF